MQGMPSVCRAIRPFVSALVLSARMGAPARAQPSGPRPHPLPKPPTAKADPTPPLTPVQTLWGLALNNALTAAPAYDGTLAFFSIEGDRMVAYELTTGVLRWTIPAHPSKDPVAGGGMIFYLESGALKALHTADGSVAWELPFADPLAVHPVWDNGWLVVAMANGEIRALRATDGQLIWTRDLKSPAHALPALAADRVYVPTTDGRVVALGVETGEALWERTLKSAPNDILALDERIYVGTRNYFHCILAADGKIDWLWRTGGDVIGRPVADDRYVYFVALDNVLRALNLVSGGQQGMRAPALRPAWGAIKAGATLVVGGQTPPLRAFNMKDGVQAGSLTAVGIAADAEAAAPPHVIDHPLRRIPMLLMLFRDIAKGASAAFVAHSLEPVLIDKVAPLPNPVQIAPVTPTTPPPRP